MFSFIKNKQIENVFRFTGTDGANDWVPFTIPAGFKNITINCLGAGGGGGGGATGATSANRFGGSGGGQGASFSATYKITSLPGTIYIQAGARGAAGASAGAGGAGGTTYVSMQPANTNGYLLALANGGGGGAAGTTAAGANGAGGAATTITNVPLAAGSLSWKSISGQSGVPATASAGTSISPTGPATGGAGGGTITTTNKGYWGGNITTTGFITPTIYGGNLNTNNGYASGFYTGSYLNCGTSANFGLGTGDFTAELWFYQTLSTTNEYEIWESQTSNAFTIWKGGNSFLSWRAYAGTTVQIIAQASIPINTWTHIAVCRSANTSRAFVNGVQSNSVADTINYVAPTAAYGLGGRITGVNGFPGFISNFRLIKGTALYTSNFTVPTTPLTGGTVLLSADYNLSDTSGNGIAITNSGVQQSGFNPFDGASLAQTKSGRSGIALERPLIFTGGSGGGAALIATGDGGGAGGNGNYGSGGGGGGGGTTSFGGGGTGGSGGAGLVIITLW